MQYLFLNIELNGSINPYWGTYNKWNNISLNFSLNCIIYLKLFHDFRIFMTQIFPDFFAFFFRFSAPCGNQCSNYRFTLRILSGECNFYKIKVYKNSKNVKQNTRTFAE